MSDDVPRDKRILGYAHAWASYLIHDSGDPDLAERGLEIRDYLDRGSGKPVVVGAALRRRLQRGFTAELAYRGVLPDFDDRMQFTRGNRTESDALAAEIFKVSEREIRRSRPNPGEGWRLSSADGGDQGELNNDELLELWSALLPLDTNPNS